MNDEFIIKKGYSQNNIRKSLTFKNKGIFLGNINRISDKLRNSQKTTISLIKRIKHNDDKELLLLKQKLYENKELKNDNMAISLIYLIYQLNGAVPKNHFDINDPNNDTLFITKKIFKILKSIRYFFFFFSHYKIDDKSIIKMIPLMGYEYHLKNRYIYKEGDNSSKMYFILKGNISFSKKVNLLEFDKPQEVEQFKMGEGQYFGEWDLVFGRKTKLSALCLENCHLIFFLKETFQKYIQEKFTKTESDMKNTLMKILANYIFMPQVKLERFVLSDVKMLFFRKNEIIYNEGEESRYIYLIYHGEANLLKNISKGEEHSLISNSLDEIKIEKIQKKAKKIDYKELFKKPLLMKNNQNILELKLNRNNYHAVATLGNGSFAGLEIVTGITYFKYTLIASNDFTSIYRINISNLEEHLNEFMLNLIPLFFELEEKIHTQIDKIKFIDYNLIPNSCKKYKITHKLNKLIDFIDIDENDETFVKQIKKIENKFDTNEGGFIKRNEYNLNLHKKRNILKEQLKENQLKDQKIDSFVKKYEKEQLSKLRYKKVRLIHSAKDCKKKATINKNNSFLCSKSKNRPKSNFINKLKNTAIVLRDGKDCSNFNMSKSVLKSANDSILINKRKNYNLFDKEEMMELEEQLRKLKKHKILIHNIPRYKLTINTIKQSLSIDCKALVKEVMINRKNNNKQNKNSNNFLVNSKIKNSIFPYNKKNKSNYKTINICKDSKGKSIIKNLWNNKSVNEKRLANRKRKNTFNERYYIKYNFYDTGLFDMPLAVQLGVS